MNIKTNLLEESLNFVDTTKKQYEYLEIFIYFLLILNLYFYLFSYLKI